MKGLFILLAGWLTCSTFVACDKESDFEKDYKVYKEGQTKKQNVLNSLLDKHQKDPYYQIYMNNEYITSSKSVHIENDMLCTLEGCFFSVADFYGYKENVDGWCLIYFWK